MTRPGRAELRQHLELASQGVTGHEGLARVNRVNRVAPEVDQPVGGSHGLRRAEREEVEVESEPSILVWIVHVDAGLRVRRVAVSVVVRGAESEEVERRTRGDDLGEGLRGQEVVEELTDGSADDDLAEGEGGEDLVERVRWETVDWR